MVVRLAGPGKLVLPLLLFHLLSAFRPPLVSGKEIQPDDTSSLLKRASDNIKVRKYGEALGLLNAAIEADPVLSEAYSQRASVLRHVCRYEESERNYKKFLELKPKSSLVEKELSQLLKAQSALDSAYNNFDRGDYSKALEYIDKIVLVFSPGCLKAKLLKVKLLLALKDYSSAISETGYILKLDEDNLEALLLRGHAYYYLADHDVASRHYQKGLRLDPEHSELKKAYFGLKNLLKKTKSAEDNASKRKLRVAVEDFKAALAMDPNHTAHNVHLHLGLCKALVKLGRGEDAINSCTEALDIDGELVEALAQRFLREQNLQLHLRAHGRETKLERSADGADRPRRVYVCPVPHCKHHDVANALGDVTAVKRHYKRKHTTERDFGCRTCDKRYAVEFDLRQHEKKCGDHRCPCGLSFTRVDFTKHQNICGQMRQVADGSIISSAAGPSLYGADGDYTNANGTSSSLPVFPMTHGSEQPPQGAEQLTAGAGLSPWLEQQGATGPSNPQFDDLSAMLDDPDFWDNLPEVPTQPLPSPISGDAFVSSPTFVNDNNGGGHPLLFGYGGENATTGDGNFGTVAPFGSVYQYCGAATGTIPTPTAPRLQNAADIGVMAASSVNPSPSSFFAGPLSSAEYLREVGFEPWGLAEGSGIVLPSSVDQMVTAANEGHSGARPPSNVEPSSSLTQLHNSILMAGGISGESNSISGLSAVPFRHELPVVTSAGGSRPLA